MLIALLIALFRVLMRYKCNVNNFLMHTVEVIIISLTIFVFFCS